MMVACVGSIRQTFLLHKIPITYSFLFMCPTYIENKTKSIYKLVGKTRQPVQTTLNKPTIKYNPFHSYFPLAHKNMLNVLYKFS